MESKGKERIGRTTGILKADSSHKKRKGVNGQIGGWWRLGKLRLLADTRYRRRRVAGNETPKGRWAAGHRGPRSLGAIQEDLGELLEAWGQLLGWVLIEAMANMWGRQQNLAERFSGSPRLR